MDFIGKRQKQNQEALDNPQIGDYWHEMYCPYFVIVDIDKNDSNRITVLSCLGGENGSEKRKHEVNAIIRNKDYWSLNYDKAMIVDKAWIKEAVTYSSSNPGFMADVVRNKSMDFVNEWNEYIEDWNAYRKLHLIPTEKELKDAYDKKHGLIPTEKELKEPQKVYDGHKDSDNIKCNCVCTTCANNEPDNAFMKIARKFNNLFKLG
jgi:hypothetical protein